MPVENELKMILKVPDVYKYREELIQKHGGKLHEITQGYLPDSNARLRHIVTPNHCDDLYVFTYKEHVDSKVVEIETPIAAHDFHKLWTVVDRVIYKHRIVVDGQHETWEIDFLKTPSTGEVYVVIAEVELPEFVYEPTEIPEFVRSHLWYAVDRHDTRFSNKNLANPERVKQLLETVTPLKRSAA